MSDNQRLFTNYELHSSQPDVQCLVCTRPFTLDTEVTDSFEALAICRECKMTVLNDDERAVTTGTYRQRRPRRRQSRTASLESTEDTFSQQFSQLINLARHGQDADIVRQQASYNSTPNQSQILHASDDESDGLSYVDSVLGDIESNISFGDYGGDSDASLDQHSMMGREMVLQLDNESYMNTDTDIDPMNAGMDQWDSDDQEEESDFDEAVDVTRDHQQQSRDFGPIALSRQESGDGVWTWRVTVSQTANVANLMADVEGPEIRTPYVGNPGDYVDARQFEMLLEQFAEDNISRRGAPPAATSFVKNLPSVVISTGHETNGSVTCPVCKDQMPTRAKAIQLPCTHLYHSSCILPWLNSRNTCPVCRYELPTDDPEYERSKQAAANERSIHDAEHMRLLQIVEEISDEPEVEGTHHTTSATPEVEGAHVAEQRSRARGHSRWLFIAAAPVVSIVSLALVLCFANPSTSSSGRRPLYRRSQSAAAAQVGSKRSWWPMF